MQTRLTEKGQPVIVCDRCELGAPPAAEIMAGHGLIRLGWYCKGGVHYCPACPHPTELPYE